MTALTDTAPIRWQARIAARATSAQRWAARTRQLIELARLTRAADLRDQIADYTYWITFTARHPELAQPHLLSELVTQFARLATNLGRGGENAGAVRSALEASIALQSSSGAPVTSLHLALATYLRAESTESDERRAALQAAVASAVAGSDDWAEAMIALCWYEVDVSRYGSAIRIARQVRAARPGGQYECAALAWEGVARFTSFQDMELAAELLAAARRYEERLADDPRIGEWVAIAYHYLARIAELGRRYRTSLELYLAGQKLAGPSGENTYVMAFEQLRIAEPLIACGLFVEARDHLDEAYRLVRMLSDRSAARLQVDLGYATLAAAAGDPRRAARTVRRALRWARSVGYWRGELLCCGYLLALAIRRGALWQLPGLGVRILASALFGELRRNNLAKLVLRIPVVLPVALRRMAGRTATRAAAGQVGIEQVTACPCERHAGASNGSRS